MIDMTLERGVLTARLSNPPCNVISTDLHGEIDTLERRIRTDDAVRVVILASRDADFFLAHYDVAYAADRPAPEEPQTDLNAFQEMCARFRESPKPVIACIAGRTGGGGIELAASCDMRFGVRGRTVFNQMEVALGILPAGGGTQNLAELIGRGRAMEMVLGCDDIDADTAAQWGLLNRVFDTAAEMEAFVAALARRIAAWPPTAVSRAKQAIDLGAPDWRDRLLGENRLCYEAMRHPDRSRLMQAFMAAGGQTPEGEAGVAAMTLANAEGRPDA
jgi:enoyl-CoA hydratase/carnithine racemase